MTERQPMTLIPHFPLAGTDYLAVWRETRRTGKSVAKRLGEIILAYVSGQPAVRPVPSKPLLSWVQVIDSVRRYEIAPRTPELGGGYNAKVFEGVEEVAAGAFPLCDECPTEGDTYQDALDWAEEQIREPA